jgi:hypothetical protein
LIYEDKIGKKKIGKVKFYADEIEKRENIQ